MAIAHARCPRCGFACADVWRVREHEDHIIQYLVCRSCAFDWATTEPLERRDSTPEPSHLVLVYSRDRHT